MTTTPRVRQPLTKLQDEYQAGNTKPLEDLMRAWKGIKELPADNPKSFFQLGGLHGEPFRGAGWGNATYWGGYCNHGNVLFPTWHRVYLIKLEEALQSVPGCGDVMLPFWDETGEDTLKNGIPWALTRKDVVLDGETIPNPLRSFVLNRAIKDNISGDDPDYSKPAGYETVRYPLSGLMGKNDVENTREHNKKYPKYDENVGLLNQNIIAWLTSSIVIGNDPPIPTNVAQKYRDALDAPNYTVFSNTTSAAEWSTVHAESAPVVPLESPHNSIHLAVGGCDIPTYDRSPIAGANGDMGENDTAGLDPIFYFHHCFVDRVFWLWQKRHGCTDHLEIMPEYPGTNSVDNQGPTPGTAPNSWLSLDSPLDPFRMNDGGRERPYTSRDCVHIETQLGYTYAAGSLDDLAPIAAAPPAAPLTRVVRVSGVKRSAIRGSFTISAYAVVEGKRHHLGTEAVLSRWHVAGCANCQTHLEAKAHIVVPRFVADALEKVQFEVEVRTRDGLLGHSAAAAGSGTGAAPRGPFRYEVR